MVMTHYQYGQTELSQKIFKERYALHDEETFQEACERLARTAASAESPNKIKEWEDKFYEELISCRFVPGGRIWAGAGKPKATMMNCFGVTSEGKDSKEGWASIIEDTIVITGNSGGVGINFSDIRPRGSLIRGNNGKSTGAVSLMKIVNTVASVIEGGGARRAAVLAALSITHPDLLEFINSKLDKSELNMMNISVLFDTMSPEEFFQKVDAGEKYDLVWKDEIVVSVKAKTIMDLIINNFLKTGDPGIQNMYYANMMNSMIYDHNVCVSNPCSEIIGQNHFSCCLGSIVLPNFMKEKNVNLKQLDKTIRRSIRFLDNIIDVNHYPTPSIKEEGKATRRIGLGTMGLHDLILMNGMKYGSDESVDYIDKLFKFIKNKSYETSTYIAAEKGSFPKFKADEYLSNGFAKNLKKSLKGKIEEHGLRNCSLNAQAPCGTISQMVGGCSSGIEAIFGPAYEIKRWMKKSEKDLEHQVITEIVFHPLFDAMMQNGEDVSHFETVCDITIEQHFRVQHIIQKHIDQSISKTIYLPDLKPNTKKEFYHCFKKYFPELKGVTVYVDKSKDEQPIVSIDLVNAKKLWRKHKNRKTQTESVDCKNGACQV